jgi:iron complex outermembrane receptor protein
MDKHRRSTRGGHSRAQLWLSASVGAVAAAIALSGPAYAETTAPGQPAATSVETVVVTARRREEALVNVPVAAETMSRNQLQQYNTTDLTTLGDQLPNVELQRTGGSSSGADLSIRGVGSLATDYGTELPVALVIDGMQLTQGHAIDLGAFDAAQVEVLEGPQALFFGKDSPAGVVAITSVSPGSKLEGYARAGYQVTTETPYFEGAVSVPVTDTLSVRFAGRYSDEQGGTVKNVAGQIADPFPFETGFLLPGAVNSERPQERFALGRFTAVWRPTSNFDATLKFAGSNYHNNGQNFTSGVVACAPGNAHPTSTDLLDPAFTFQDPFGPCNLNNHTISVGQAPTQISSHFLGGPADGKPFYDSTVFLTTLTMNYRINHVTLTSVTGFYSGDSSGYDNYDNTVFAQALDASSQNDKTVTQEFRAVSSFDFPLNFAAGVFYEYDHRILHNTDKIFPLGPDPDPGPYAGMWNTAATVADNHTQSYSGFGQLTWNIVSNLELAGGARVSHDSKSADLFQAYNRLDEILPPAFNPFSPAGLHYDPKVDETNVSPEVTLTWHPVKNYTLYAAYKEGYLAGGAANPGNLSNYPVLCAAQPGCANPASLLEYKPETVKGEEIGAKASMLGGALYSELTLFRYEYDNLQVTAFDSATTSYFTTNAAQALNQGVEFKARYRVNANFSVHGFLTYTDLHFEKFTTAECYSGQTPATGCVGGEQDLSGTGYGGPPWEFNLGANYSHAVGNGWSAALAGDLYHHSTSPRANNDPFSPGGYAYWSVNAALRLYQDRGPLELAVIGANLTNVTVIDPNSLGKPLGAPGDLDSPGLLMPPREVALQATYRF